MMMMKEMAIMDITVRDYGRRSSKTRFYISFEDLPWDIETEEFWPETDEYVWNRWKEEVEKEICGIGIVRVEFKVLENWGKNELNTFYVKEF